MNANLQLAAQIIDARFNNPPPRGQHVMAASLRFDEDHEALAQAIALIIQHLDPALEQVGLPSDGIDQTH